MIFDINNIILSYKKYLYNQRNFIFLNGHKFLINTYYTPYMIKFKNINRRIFINKDNLNLYIIVNKKKTKIYININTDLFNYEERLKHLIFIHNRVIEKYNVLI